MVPPKVYIDLFVWDNLSHPIIRFILVMFGRDGFDAHKYILLLRGEKIEQKKTEVKKEKRKKMHIIVRF